MVKLIDPGPSFTPLIKMRALSVQRELAVERFCAQFNEALWREEEILDPLTDEIFQAAREKGINVKEFMSTTEEGEPPWLEKARQILDVWASSPLLVTSLHRVQVIWDGSRAAALQDPDAKMCLVKALAFFEGATQEPEILINFAGCLLDYMELSYKCGKPPSFSPDLGKNLQQHLLCKYPGCRDFGTRSYGRYCDIHEGADNPACKIRPCDETSLPGRNLCKRHYMEAWNEGCLKESPSIAQLERNFRKKRDNEAYVKESSSTALAKMPPSSELELRQLTSQTNFGKSLRMISVVLGVGAALVTQSVMVLPFILVGWVMAYCFIDHSAIEAQKQRALKSGEAE